MATSGISRNSDVVMYYCCTICETERSAEIDADFYCEECLKYFCRTCIHSHKQHGWWFYKKSPYGKDKIMKWPLSKKMETSLLTCVIHKGEKLTMYCLDHSQLCCSKCFDLNHRRCLQVTPLPQAATGKSTNFKNLSVSTENTLSQMKQCQTYQEDRIKSLKVSYKEHERLIVDGLRVNIVSYLRKCESTVNTTHEHMQYPISEMREEIKYLLADFERSTIKEKKDDLNLKQAPLKVVRNSCIRLHYELFHLHVAIPKVLGNKPELSFIASKKCLENIQQSDIFIKENFSNKVFTVNGKSVHNVKMPSESKACEIRAVCALPNGQVLVEDYYNNRVKLLNQKYRVVSHLDVRDEARDMCLITPTEVAVAVSNYEVQFITVSQSQLAKSRKLKLQHECTGIAHNQGDLYICSGTALYKFTLSGELVCRLYKDSADLTVDKCAVSPTGDRLYITSWYKHKLLTLARDGTLLATYSDPALEWPCGLHVTPAGQVLVCGAWSHTVLQVGWEGESELATLATQEDGVWGPRSVCYSSTTSSIIVGLDGDDILVFRVE